MHSINDYWQKIKLFGANIKEEIYSPEKGLKIKGDLFIVILIILVGTASFGLGKLSAFEKRKTPISIVKTEEEIYSSVDNIQNQDSLNTSDYIATNSVQKGLVVASKSGTKYYYPWCTGVLRIKEENKVWFATIKDAQSAGLTPASGCTGLK